MEYGISYILNMMNKENEKLKSIHEKHDFLEKARISGTLSVEVSFYDDERQVRRRITEYGSKAAYAILRELQDFYKNEENECNSNLNIWLEKLKSK